MATFHSRSNSFPSKSHPAMESVEDHLCRLKSSEAASTSASSICVNLDSLRDLHEGFNNLIQMPSVQQALSQGQGESWVNELLEESLRLVDLCGFSRDVKEDQQDGQEMHQEFEELKPKFYTTPSHRDNAQETEALDFSVLKSVLMLLSGEKEGSKQRSWSLLSKFTQTKRVHSEVEQENSAEDLYSLNIHKSRKGMDNITLKHLKSAEMCIQDLEEGLEALFRSLVKTRVSLLNVLSH
ncbi:UNVERIFIED_CONTAM: hypothetical protein Slati_2313100 [Sesamum latifolium]|uniref:Uncharacterized protein n=1 Tax=Sesamum latifolium TaxID=2727402 RepID=A0AAW2WC71_9LAMI